MVGELKPGVKKELAVTVEEKMTAQHLGSGTVPVLATPYMILLMENTAMESVIPYLGPGQATVGVAVHVQHLAATPMGMQVRVTTELIALDGRRLTFKVEAYDAAEKVGEGTHERVIIDVARFADRIQRKLEGKL